MYQMSKRLAKIVKPMVHNEMQMAWDQEARTNNNTLKEHSTSSSNGESQALFAVNVNI